MKLSYQEIGQVCASFWAEPGMRTGDLCKVAGNGTVGACAKNDVFHGVAAMAHNDMAAVVLRGFITVKYTGAAPAVGDCVLSAASASEVQVSETGRHCLVVSVDTENREVSILL